MIIDCIGCLHGATPKLDGGDLLIITGDCTVNDSIPAWNLFFNWLDKQDYKRKVMVAGNHDNFCKQWATAEDSVHDVFLGTPSVSYLCDSETEFKGVKIWGSPWTASFKGINSKCKAFTIPVGKHQEEKLKEKWDLIPEDADILITHSPPYGILDGIPVEDGSLFHVGSKSLEESRGIPRLHVFSHIHEGYGQTKDTHGTTSVNCSIMNAKYRPVNAPIRIIL